MNHLPPPKYQTVREALHAASQFVQYGRLPAFYRPPPRIGGLPPKRSVPQTAPPPGGWKVRRHPVPPPRRGPRLLLPTPRQTLVADASRTDGPHLGERLRSGLRPPPSLTDSDRYHIRWGNPCSCGCPGMHGKDGTHPPRVLSYVLDASSTGDGTFSGYLNWFVNPPCQAACADGAPCGRSISGYQNCAAFFAAGGTLPDPVHYPSCGVTITYSCVDVTCHADDGDHTVYCFQPSTTGFLDWSCSDYCCTCDCGWVGWLDPRSPHHGGYPTEAAYLAAIGCSSSATLTDWDISFGPGDSSGPGIHWDGYCGQSKWASCPLVATSGLPVVPDGMGGYTTVSPCDSAPPCSGCVYCCNYCPFDDATCDATFGPGNWSHFDPFGDTRLFWAVDPSDPTAIRGCNPCPSCDPDSCDCAEASTGYSPPPAAVGCNPCQPPRGGRGPCDPPACNPSFYAKLVLLGCPGWTLTIESVP